MRASRRIVLGLCYDGNAYHGWQIQHGLITVQFHIERALSRLANHKVQVTCAGRTDSGVHASAQIVHFDSHADRKNYSWVLGTNANLPEDIRVLWAKPVSSEFHARFSAKSRTYRYLLYNKDIKPGIFRHFVGWYQRPLDVLRMQEAADYLLGSHDFSAFRGAGCQAKNPVRTLEYFQIKRQHNLIIFEIKSNAFLFHMVRNIVGTLLPIGAGNQDPCSMQSVLSSCDRRQSGVTISPFGLYLVKVDYPEKYSLPKTAPGPFILSQSLL